MSKGEAIGYIVGSVLGLLICPCDKWELRR
jgi:hypothetical protein